MGKYIMALDQGTTSSRCILFDREGRMCSVAQKEYTQHYPQPGWVEHDPMEIWSSQLSVAIEAMGQIGADAEDIHSIGITNQRETTIVWDKRTGKPVYPAIVWQCRRTADMIEKLEKEGFSDVIRHKTGLIPDAYFSATKICWILDHTEGAREEAQKGNLLFGTVDTWLIWKLTKGEVHVTDYTNASRTMLFNIHEKHWDQEILDYFRIPFSMLPQVRPSSCIYGYTNEKLIGGRIPIAGAAGDQQAALFGQCCFKPGDVKNTYGTGCFLLMHTGDQMVESSHGLLTTMAVNADGTPGYALEGSVFVAGAAIQWLRDEAGLLENAAASEKYCLSVSDTNGVYVVPAFTGLGAPYWAPVCKRCDPGTDQRSRESTSDPCYSRIPGLSGARRDSCYGEGFRDPSEYIEGRWRGQRQQFPDAVSGRSSGCTGSTSRMYRDNCPGGCLSGRPCHRILEGQQRDTEELEYGEDFFTIYYRRKKRTAS